LKQYKIIYEDEAVIVVDKPSGMLVIPTPKMETNTLTALLNRELDLRSVEVNAYPCHRLDRETSGLIVYAKGKHFQGIIMDEFKKRQVKKLYIAFVHGKLPKNFDELKSEIYNRNKRRGEVAITKYKVTGRRKNFTIAEVEPVTGRTNQIRIQFKELGHPLVGESVYAFRKDFSLKFKRAALHAKRIEFIHPVTKKLLTFDSPMADDMNDFLKKHPV